MSENYKPQGFHTVTPYLLAENVDNLIAFIIAAFDGVEKLVNRSKDGHVEHAEIIIGDSILELSQAREEWKAMPTALHIYVPNADTTYQQALQAGALSLFDPQDRPYGDREAGVKDISGNYWYIATRIA